MKLLTVPKELSEPETTEIPFAPLSNVATAAAALATLVRSLTAARAGTLPIKSEPALIANTAIAEVKFLTDLLIVTFYKLSHSELASFWHLLEVTARLGEKSGLPLKFTITFLLNPLEMRHDANRLPKPCPPRNR